MQNQKEMKNYYAILEIPMGSSSFEIDNAYQKLATKWHPDKHKEDRKLAEKKFHQISQAFEVLSDKNSRSHYDEMMQQKYSLDDANGTFQRFFGEHGIIDEDEEKFFNTHYPNNTQNYYRILGVNKNASLDDIKKAYRKLALKYHPKNNANDENAHKKFVQINEAFNALSSQQKRRTYNNVILGEMVPHRAHNLFQDYFGNHFLEIPSEEQFFRPIMRNKWSRTLDKMMDQESDMGNIKDGQTIKSNTVYSNNNGVETKKTVTTQKDIKDGKANEKTTQEYLYPNGSRDIKKTIRQGSQITSSTYHLEKGQQLPKELQN